MRKSLAATLLLSGLFVLPAVGGDRDWQQEVAHLLTFIEDSNCSFIRNGKVYDAEQAREHISKKYEYVKKRISSTEQFITYAASKSSITGNVYQVTCGEMTVPSSEWLAEELLSYRSAHK